MSPERALLLTKMSAARIPSPQPTASAIRQMPRASETIIAPIRSEGQPTARRIPISRVRSNTDIAIVLVTPIPPTISARIETIQPVEMISRLDVSTLIASPGSVIDGDPGVVALEPLRHRLDVLAELDRDADRGDLPGPLRQRLDGVQRQDDAEILEPVARVVDPGDGERLPGNPNDVAEMLAGMVAGHHVASPALRDDEAAVRELVRVETEDECAAVDEKLHLRDGRDAGVAGDLRRE